MYYSSSSFHCCVVVMLIKGEGGVGLGGRALDPFCTHPKNTHLLGDFWVWVYPFCTYPSNPSKWVTHYTPTRAGVGFLKPKLPKIASNTHRIPKIFGIFWVWVGMGIHSHPPTHTIFCTESTQYPPTHENTEWV